jgi:hypothetical protein
MSDTIKYRIGLDLGQTGQFTALAVLEQMKRPDPFNPDRLAKHYAVRHLERFAPGIAFAQICARLQTLLTTLPRDETIVAVDQTAVGEPVVRLLRRARLRVSIRPVTITAGNQVQISEGGGWLVPKRDLVSTFQLLLQSQRIKVASCLPEAQILVQELLRFRAKVALAANDTLDAWREGPHDDLVLAVAIAAWMSEQLRELWIYC